MWRSEHFETVWTKPWLLLFKWDKTTARDVIFGSGWLINQPQSWNDEENWRWASDLGINSPASGDQDPHMKGMTHLLGSNRRIFSVWQVVEMLSGGGEKKPTTKDCILNQLGALEWFECSRALVCSSSEVFTSVNYRVLGLFLLSTSLIFYPVITIVNSFTSMSGDGLVVGLTPLFLFPFLMFFRVISLVCAPATHMFSYWTIEFQFPRFCCFHPFSSPFLPLKSCLELNLAGSIASGLWPVNGRSARGGHIDTGWCCWCLDSKNENSATKNGDIYGYNSSSYSAYVILCVC